MTRHNRSLLIGALVVAVAACQGVAGPAGKDGKDGTNGQNGQNGENGAPGETGATGGTGEQGPKGDPGTPGADGCDTPSLDGTNGLSVALTVAPPANGTHFVAGEHAAITIRFTNRCGRAYAPADLQNAGLYMAGPIGTLATRSANKLLNAIVDRAATDRQHHYVNLKAPKFLDTAQHNLATAEDRTITFTTAGVSDEAAGTYTIGVWAKTVDDRDQVFETVNVQVGTATVATETSGPPTSSSCLACHQGSQSGKVYMHHTKPERSPYGSWGLDEAPITTCRLCHNTDGYSANPIIRKVHGIHRGSGLLAPGAAHPDYGLAAEDTTLAEFADVEFPSMPGGDRDCIACHQDDAWKTKPSRLACGTCHDNVFFSEGRLNPPRNLGKPTAGACTIDDNCRAGAKCNTATGECEQRSHPVMTSDVACASCHTSTTDGISPIMARHLVAARDGVRGLVASDIRVEGGTGAGGIFAVGDTPTLYFKLADKAGNNVDNLKTASTFAMTYIVAGPTDDRQTIYSVSNAKTSGTLSYNATTQTYSYAPATPIPAKVIVPSNRPAGWLDQAPASGTYTLYAYVTETTTVNGVSTRDVANIIQHFKFGADLPLRPRDIITKAACNDCHQVVQGHGGSRTDPTTCGTCHVAGAVDKAVGSKGNACTSTAQCAGGAGGWETCQDTNNDTTLDTCVITTDPTPDRTIEFGPMVHAIHSASRRGAYDSRNDFLRSNLSMVGFRNSLIDFSEIEFPMDLRNCTNCHASTLTSCSATNPCGIGQACVSGKCVNSAWKSEPTAKACLSCHNSEAAYAHTRLNTWLDGATPVESCRVCHAGDATFAVDKVHNVSNPYVPPSLGEDED